MKSSIIRFGIVGAISTVLDMGILNLGLFIGLNIYLATALGFFTGLTNGFFMNTRYVFGTDGTTDRYIKYALVSLGGLGWTELIMHLLAVDPGHLGKNVAKLCAVAIVFFWNYILSKAWAFK